MNQPSQVTIENPTINSPYAQSTRYFKFSSDGITGDIIDGRCPSRRGSQLSLKNLWVEDRFEPKWRNYTYPFRH